MLTKVGEVLGRQSMLQTSGSVPFVEQQDVPASQQVHERAVQLRQQRCALDVQRANGTAP